MPDIIHALARAAAAFFTFVRASGFERARLWWSDEGDAARQHVVALVTLSPDRLVALLGFIIQSTTRMKNLFYPSARWKLVKR
jgi:hypothetical protein